MNHEGLQGTTILCVKKYDEVVIASDGQVSFNNTIIKSNADKIRVILDGKIVAGFAGSTADAMALFERLENKLREYSHNLVKSVVELARDWRTNKFLRQLNAMLIVADIVNMFILSGSGDVIEPESGVAAIGSGGSYALAAARALMPINGVSALDIVTEAMKIAAGICIYTNHNITIKQVRT